MPRGGPARRGRSWPGGRGTDPYWLGAVMKTEIPNFDLKIGPAVVSHTRVHQGVGLGFKTVLKVTAGGRGRAALPPARGPRGQQGAGAAARPAGRGGVPRRVLGGPPRPEVSRRPAPPPPGQPRLLRRPSLCAAAQRPTTQHTPLLHFRLALGTSAHTPPLPTPRHTAPHVMVSGWPLSSSPLGKC